MAQKSNSLEGGTNGTTITTANSGGASGNAFDTVTIGTGAAVTFSTDFAAHGSVSCKIVNPTGVTSYVVFSGYATSSMAVRAYFYFASLPGASGPIRLIDVRTASTSVTRVVMDTSNRFILQTNNGTTTLKTFTAISAGGWYRIDLATTNGTSGATVKMDYYNGDSTSPVETGYSTTTANTGVTTNLTQAYFGAIASPGATVTFYQDDIAAIDGTTSYIGPAATPPTAAFTSSTLGLDGIFDGTTSTAVNPATISSYSWNFGDGNTGVGATPTHTYATAGSYTVTLTVTDSNSLTDNVSHSVVITAPGTQADPRTVTTSTGLTSTSGSVLNSVTDKSSGAPILTTFSYGADGAVLRGAINPISPPASGNPFFAILAVDRVSSSTGTVTCKLFEADGTTLRSNVTVSIPDMTASGGSGTSSTGTLGNGSYVQVAWPWTDVQNVVDWNQLVYEFTFHVS